MRDSYSHDRSSTSPAPIVLASSYRFSLATLIVPVPIRISLKSRARSNRVLNIRSATVATVTPDRLRNSLIDCRGASRLFSSRSMGAT